MEPDLSPPSTAYPEVETDTAPTNQKITDPLTTQRFTNLNDLSHELSSLQDLAQKGSWRSILDKVSRARSLSLLRCPHDHLIYLCFNALALAKLRRFSDALEEIESLEDLESPSYRYEAYPQIYTDRSGSMVPFSLRWLHAQLPSKLGKRIESLDRLYALLDFVRSRIDRVDEGDLKVSAAVWKRREEFVISAIMGHHLSQKEFCVCLDLIRAVLARDYDNPALISKLGYVQLQFGDLDGAKASFAEVERLSTAGSTKMGEVEMRNLVGRNKALSYLVGKDYVSAVREYDECIERDGSDAVAVNNKGICLMYLRDLSDSIKVLENSLERIPTVALNETLVVNLCSMYELAYVNHGDIKKTLSNWIARVAPDDFDSTCTRI